MFEFVFLFLITSFLILCTGVFFFHKFVKNKNIEQSLRIDVESPKLDTKYFIASIIFVVFILSISLFFPLALIFNQLGLEYLLCKLVEKYMPEYTGFITSENISCSDYIENYNINGVSKDSWIHVLVGDIQRLKIYGCFIFKLYK